MNINKYLRKRYKYPPCWCLVVDVHRNELGLKLQNYQSNDESTLAIAKEFRKRLAQGAHGFNKLDAPENMSVVLMSKPGYHVGIYYSGSVLHAGKNGVQYQPLYVLKDQYKLVEFWKYG